MTKKSKRQLTKEELDKLEEKYPSIMKNFSAIKQEDYAEPTNFNIEPEDYVSERSRDIKEIEIKCPICNNIHIYPIKIMRSVFVYQFYPGDRTTKYINYKRIFLCLNTNDAFEAVIRISKKFNEKIQSVEL